MSDIRPKLWVLWMSAQRNSSRIKSSVEMLDENSIDTYDYYISSVLLKSSNKSVTSIILLGPTGARALCKM